MVTSLIGKQGYFKTRQFEVTTSNVPRVKKWVSKRHPKQDQDAKNLAFLTKAVFWMMIIAMTPLVLFYMIILFSPDFFQIPITPN